VYENLLVDDHTYVNMVKETNMSSKNLEPPPLPSRNPPKKSIDTRNPSASNKGRPLPPPPAYQNFELPTENTSKVKKCETLPNFKTVREGPPKPPPVRSVSVKSSLKGRSLPPPPVVFSLTTPQHEDKEEPPALPPPRAPTFRRNTRSPLPPPPKTSSPQDNGSNEG